MKQNSPGYYAIIPAPIRYDNQLKPAEKLLYGELSALAEKDGFCWPSNKYFADLYGVTKETVSRWISHLKELGYIDILDRADEENIRYIYVFVATATHERSIPLDKKVNTPLDKKVNPYIKERNKNNNVGGIDLRNEFSGSILDAVSNWVAYKNERNEKYKSTGLSQLIGKIKKSVSSYGEKAVIDLIQTSMANNWKGIIWDKLEKQPPKQEGGLPTL